MTFALVIRNVASVTKGMDKSANSAQNTRQLGNVQCLPKRKVKKVQPHKPAKSLTRFDTQAEQTERIVDLEDELQNLWHHYAANRKQKLELMDENSELQSEICRLHRSVSHERRMRGIAEAKLEDKDCNPDI